MAKAKGFKLGKKADIIIDWPEGHELHGLEITTRGRVSSGVFLELSGYSEQEATGKLTEAFARHAKSWNLEDDDGEPVELSLASIKDAIDIGSLTHMLTAWLTAVGGSQSPLAQTSASGSTNAPGGPVIPMESLQ